MADNYEGEEIKEKKIKNERALNFINKMIEVQKNTTSSFKGWRKEKHRKTTFTYKIEELLKILNKGLIGKEKIIKMALFSLLAKENTLLIGPPGTAKSEISKRLTKVLEKGSYFEYLLTKFTTPEEIFGPFSIKNLKEDKLARNMEGFIPTSQIVFLDEIFKGNSSVLNSLLSILNERVFHNGVKKEAIPLVSLIGASNEIPFEEEEVAAFYDRFLIRLKVDYIEKEKIGALLDINNTGIKIPDDLKITTEELKTIESESKKIKIPDNIKNTIKEIRNEYTNVFKDDKSESISDRKIVKIGKILKVSALVNGRKNVDYSDLILLTNCLWNNPDNAETVNQIILETLKRNLERIED